MESKIDKALKLKYEPITILWSDRKPEDSIQFKESKWEFSTMMWLPLISSLIIAIFLKREEHLKVRK